MRRNRAAFVFCLSIFSASLLTGCETSEEESLAVWMQTERESIRPNVTPISEPTRFEPFQYQNESLLEPFSSQKLAAILKNGQRSVNRSTLIDAELERRKQPLESFPLDTMSMVGSMKRNGDLVAIIKIGGLLYQVAPGAYLGQNYGRITTISENELTLREIAQDAAGEWIERPASLQLQEDTSK